MQFLSTTKAQTLITNTSQLNFGVVYENAPDSLQLIISNNFGKTVNVTGIHFYTFYGQPAFSCSNSSLSIASGSSQTIWIKFSPRHNVYHNSELVIENDAQRGYLSIDLLGQGRYSNTYYNATENQDEEALKTTLQTITGNGYITLTYNPARDTMFMWLDNQRLNGQGAVQNTLECVYTGRLAVGYVSRTDCQTNDTFNTEHTFPQTFFSSNEPMKSDLHHLFPTDDDANNKRANYPFGIVTNASWSVGGSKFDNNTNIFEPRDQHKGETARAMMYFVVRYQNYMNFFNSQESILKIWNHNFIPGVVEQVRNDHIYSVQGNRNPFVDYPQFADRITSFSTTSVAPAINSMDETENAINYGFVLNGSSNVYQYVIVNNGNQSIQFSNLSLSNTSVLSFSGMSGNDTLIDPGEALGIMIDLHPSSTGMINEMLTFHTTVPGSSTVQVPIVAQSSLVNMNELYSDNQVRISPNPVQDEFTVYGLHPMDMGFAVDELSITDLLGKKVFSKNHYQSASESKLTITNLCSGIYLLNVQQKDKTISRVRFVKN